MKTPNFDENILIEFDDFINNVFNSDEKPLGKIISYIFGLPLLAVKIALDYERQCKFKPVAIGGVVLNKPDGEASLNDGTRVIPHDRAKKTAKSQKLNTVIKIDNIDIKHLHLNKNEL